MPCFFGLCILHSSSSRWRLVPPGAHNCTPVVDSQRNILHGQSKRSGQCWCQHGTIKLLSLLAPSDTHETNEAPSKMNFLDGGIQETDWRKAYYLCTSAAPFFQRKKPQLPPSLGYMSFIRPKTVAVARESYLGGIMKSFWNWKNVDDGELTHAQCCLMISDMEREEGEDENETKMRAKIWLNFFNMIRIQKAA